MERQCRMFLLLSRQILGIGVALLPLRAADPIIGSWRLDTAGSKFVMPAPKEQTEVYRELASGDIQLVLTRTQKDGVSTSTTLTWPTAGGAVHDPAAALPKGDTIIETLLAPGDWLMTRLRNGTQYLTMHKLIGEDGKTMVQTIKAIGPRGRPVEQVQIFHRE